MTRRTFKIDITVNQRNLTTLVIDPHYELKHSDSMSDALVIELVGLLDGGDFFPETVSNGFEYYTADDLVLRGKKYRLVWLLEKNSLYLGVVNAYRRRS